MSIVGYAIINGHQFDVSLIELREGHFVVHLTGRGPCVLEGPITLVGSDGRGVLQDQYIPRRKIPARATIDISVKMRVTAVEEEASQFAWLDR